MDAGPGRWGFFVVLVVLASLAGCSLGNGPTLLQEARLRSDGQPEPPGFWDAAPALAGQSGWRADAWFLPTWVSGERTAIDAGGERASSSAFTVVNPGLTVLPWLPLWISVDTQVDSRAGTHATGGMTWTPLFTHTDDDLWPRGEPALRAWGWPLLYGQLTYGPADGEELLEIHNLLWSLGPAWGRADLADEGKPIRGWFFVPLAFAGLGPIVWSSSEMSTPDEEVTVHGPLHGYLGYRSVVDREACDFSRIVAAGILWYDSANAMDPDVASESRHGPLWGMFGWGRSNGQPAMYLLWIPVPL